MSGLPSDVVRRVPRIVRALLRRRWLARAVGAVSAVLLVAVVTAGTTSATSLQSPPLPLPPGAPLPSGASLPSSLEGIVEQFLADGSLPANLSAEQVAALLAAPESVLPAGLVSVLHALRVLGGEALGGPVAAEVSCLLGGASQVSPPYGDLRHVPWAAPAVRALSATGMLSGIFDATSTGGLAPLATVPQWQWLALVLRVLGALPAGSPAGSEVTSPAAIMRIARHEGLFAAGGVVADPGASLDLGDAMALAVRGLGLAAAANEVAAAAPLAGTGAASSASGALTLAVRLGLLEDVGASAAQPFTRADAAVVAARALALFEATLQALGGPTIAAVAPTPLEAGTTATITGDGFGEQGGTVEWQPSAGGASGLRVSSWSTTKVVASLPASVALGAGRLVVETRDGAKASAATEVVSFALRVLRRLPGGDVELLANGRRFYVSAAAAAAVARMPLAAQLEWAAQAGLDLGASGPQGGPAGQHDPPAVKVTSLPAPRVEELRRHPTLAAGAGDPCATGCETIYGPGVTPYSPALTSTQVSYDVPCVTILGHKVCSGWADGSAELGGMVDGLGYPNGYFSEVGSSLSGASLVTGASMSATIGLTYTPKHAGDLVVVEARVITDQVDGGVGVAGAGTAPVYAYGAATGYGTEKETVASRLSTMSASVASWPDLSAVDLADEALTKLDAINDAAQTLWQLGGLPGEVGTGHVSTFTWSEIAEPGQSLAVTVDTESLVASNGLSQTEVNAVSGVVLVKVLEVSPTTGTTGPTSACTNPPGVSGRLAITSVTPPAAPVGATVTVRGTGFGRAGDLAFYSPVLGTVTDAPVESWGPGEVEAQVPYAPFGASRLLVLPSPYSCSPEAPSPFTIEPPTVASTTLATAYAGPTFTVTGEGFGPAPCATHLVRLECTPGTTAGREGPGTVSLELVRGAGGGVPPAAVTLNATPYLASWTNSGFSLPLGPLLTGPFAHLAPGTYRVRLTRTFSNEGFALSEVRSPTTSGSLDFVRAGHWPLRTITVTRDLGVVTIPTTTLQSVEVAGAAQANGTALPGGSVVVSGSGFGDEVGSVVLVGPFHLSTVPPSEGWPGDRGTYVVPAADLDAWSAHRVVFSVPTGVQSGTFSLWVLHAGWGPWSEASGPRSLAVGEAGCPCLRGGGACPASGSA